MLVDNLSVMAVVLSQNSTAQLRGLDSDTADQKEFNLFIWTLQGSIGAKSQSSSFNITLALTDDTETAFSCGSKITDS